MYKDKYLKYKLKYLSLKNQQEGGGKNKKKQAKAAEISQASHSDSSAIFQEFDDEHRPQLDANMMGTLWNRKEVASPHAHHAPSSHSHHAPSSQAHHAPSSHAHAEIPHAHKAPGSHSGGNMLSYTINYNY